MLNLIDQLPQASRYHAAVANDDEHVEAILAATEGQPKREVAPPLAEWTQDAELLASIKDSIEVLISTTIATSGTKPPRVKPTKRPNTKYEDVRQRRMEERHQRTVARVMKRARQVE